jgi:hypothetical protein
MKKLNGYRHDFIVFDESDKVERGIVATIRRSRNWGLVCGFGYGFASATFAFLILLFMTAPGV